MVQRLYSTVGWKEHEKKLLHSTGIVAVFLFLFSVSTVFAAPVSEVMVRRVAQSFLRHQVKQFGPWVHDFKPTVSKIQLVEYEGEPIAYNVSVKPSGYLLIPYHDEFTPVVLFSYGSSFEPSRVTQPDSVESWILPEMNTTHKNRQKFQEQIKSDKNLVSETTQVSKSWKFYGDDTVASTVSSSDTRSNVEYTTSQVAPLLTTTWNQAPYYNNLTPAGTGAVGTCDHTVTGCVATAWSQILRYWQWPDKGVGSNSYAWNGTTLSADFSQSVYDWGNMPSALSSSSSSTQVNAVAKLMSDVGIAVNMNYGCGTSYGGVSPSTLQNYFKYKLTQVWHSRNDYTASTWFDLFKTEIDATLARPVMFVAQSSNGGHAFVADGYQTDGITSKVHVNLGWGGYADAYYDVYNDFTTGAYSWIGSSHAIITGIEPNDPKDFTLTVSKDGPGTGAVAVSGPGIFVWSGDTGTNGYSSGAVVTLTATPDNGSIFTGWSGGGCNGTGSCTVAMSSDVSVTATFSTSVVLSETFDTNSVPSGWTVDYDPAGAWWFGTMSWATNYVGGTGGFAWGGYFSTQPDAYIDIELRTPVLDLSNYSTINLSFKSLATATADVDISLNGSSGPWINIVRKDKYSGPENVNVILTTLAAGKNNIMVRFHYYGVHGYWQIDDVLINGMPSPPVLSVSVTGNGGGTVTSNPQGTDPTGITCTSGTCTTSFPYGQSVSLLQAPNALSTFVGWGNACSGTGVCSLTMDSAKTVSATFSLAPKAKIGSNGYGSFADAYAAANSNDIIMLLEDILPFSTVVDKALILQGGYKADFSRSSSGFTGLGGVLNIGMGSVVVDRVIILPSLLQTN
ncbi:C10 family peptidase [Trichlorobacter lovleyi]|uniref:C10 family peptidase n=1 Tax=Trichlorobacter lovleyi TaxID=313985 RepID=UPI003D09B4A8